jgi:hypothetical protein
MVTLFPIAELIRKKVQIMGEGAAPAQKVFKSKTLEKQLRTDLTLHETIFWLPVIQTRIA